MAFHKPSPATQGCRNKNLFVNHILLHSDTCSHGDSEGPTYEKDILAKNDQNKENKKQTLVESQVVIDNTKFMSPTERQDRGSMWSPKSWNCWAICAFQSILFGT